MRLSFAGTPHFAAVILDALLTTGHRVAAVYTQPDRPAGRGRRTRPGAVKTLALARWRRCALSSATSWWWPPTA